MPPPTLGPTGSAGPLPCLRCGDFVSGEKLVTAGVGLCRECFDRRLDDEGPTFERAANRRRYRRVLLWGAVLGLAATLFGVLHVPLGPPSQGVLGALFVYAFVGTLAGEALAFVVLLTRILFFDNRTGWKRPVLDRLGYEQVSAERFLLVGIKVVGRKGEMALLLEDEGGLALIGSRGSRLALGFREIVFAKAITPRWFPWVVFLGLKRRDGTVVVIRSREGPTLGANRRATQALVERVLKKVPPRPKPRAPSA